MIQYFRLANLVIKALPNIDETNKIYYNKHPFLSIYVVCGDEKWFLLSLSLSLSLSQTHTHTLYVFSRFVETEVLSEITPPTPIIP